MKVPTNRVDSYHAHFHCKPPATRYSFSFASGRTAEVNHPFLGSRNLSMSDPVSTIKTTIESTIAIIKYVKNVEQAPKERETLLKELEDTRSLLDILKDRAENPHRDNELTQTMNWLATRDGPLEQFKQALKTLSSKLESGDGFEKARRNLMWPFDQKDIEAVLNRIERQKSLFQLASQNELL